MTRLCSKCVTEPAKKEAPWCVDHSFLEVPSQKFVTFPVGVVNEEGQTLKKWLEELDLKYSSINNEGGFGGPESKRFQKATPSRRNRYLHEGFQALFAVVQISQTVEYSDTVPSVI